MPYSFCSLFIFFFKQKTAYEMRISDWSSDVCSSDLPTGTLVVAPADGVVILAADHPFTLEGNLLMIDHGMGLNSAFLHLSEIDVKVGDRVRQGQAIARSGASGRATGPHLPWSLQWRDAQTGRASCRARGCQAG